MTVRREFLLSDQLDSAGRAIITDAEGYVVPQPLSVADATALLAKPPKRTLLKVPASVVLVAFVAALVLAFCAGWCSAEDAVETPQADTYGAAFLTRQRIFSTLPASDTWGARFIGQAGFKRVGLGARIDISGLPDTFDVNDPRTVTTIESWGSWYYAVKQSQGLAAGPTVLVGGTVGYDPGGKPLTRTRALSWLAGLRLSGRGGWVVAGLGQHDLSKCPVCPMVSARVPLTSSIGLIGDALVSRKDWWAKAGVDFVMAR